MEERGEEARGVEKNVQFHKNKKDLSLFSAAATGYLSPGAVHRQKSVSHSSGDWEGSHTGQLVSTEHLTRTFREHLLLCPSQSQNSNLSPLVMALPQA